MKKLFLTLGIAALFMTACNNTPAETEAPAEDTIAVVEEVAPVCPMQALNEEFANYANLDEAGQAALVQKAIELFNEMDANKPECCNHEGEEAPVELTEEQKAECEAMHAKMEEMKAQWANIATMTMEEQYNLIMARMDMMKACCKHAEEAAPAEVAPEAAPAE